jgi:AcrR family transcriptional regulator
MPRTEQQLERIRYKAISSILDCSLELFASKGFRGTTIQDIAEKANISKGLIYNYFKTKDEILEIIFRQRLTLCEDLIAALSKIKNAKKRVEKLIEFEINEIKTKEKLYRLYYTGALMPKNTEIVKNMTAKFSKNIGELHKKLLKVLCGKKVFGTNTENNIILLRACLLGIIVGHLINPKEFQLEPLKNCLLGKIK